MMAGRRSTWAVVAFLMLVTPAPLLAQPAAKPSPPAKPAAAGKADQGGVDLAYGAFQRGYYLTAFAEATKLAQQGDPVAMTLLGELYAQGFGVGHNDGKAAEWYKLAADRGDRNAMFALAMFEIAGRGVPRNFEDATRLLERAAGLGQPLAAYDLGLLYLKGQQVPQDLAKAASLFEKAAQEGNPEAQYALATMYKEGRGVPKDIRRAMGLMRVASLAGNLDAMVEFAIGEFNGTGVAKNEAAAAQLLLKASRRGSPIAQNRLARILMAGRGTPADPVEAIKWHIVSKAGGASDPDLDLFASKQPESVREAAEKAAKKWMSTLNLPRP